MSVFHFGVRLLYLAVWDVMSYLDVKQIGNFWVNRSYRRNRRDAQAVDSIWKADCGRVFSCKVSIFQGPREFTCNRGWFVRGRINFEWQFLLNGLLVSRKETSSTCWALPIKNWFRIVLRENVVKDFSQLIFILLKEPRCQETTVVMPKPIHIQTHTNTLIPICKTKY